MAVIKREVKLTVDGVKLVNKTMSRTSTGDELIHRKLTVTQASEIQVDLPSDIGDAREVTIENVDATNFIRIGFSTGSYVMRCYPSSAETFSVEPGTSSLFFIADTADCKAEVIVNES